MLTDTSDFTQSTALETAWVQSQSYLLIFEVENEIIDFCSDLLSNEKYSLSKLDNVVFSLWREKRFENKQFSLSGQISIHVHYWPPAGPSI